MQNVQGYSPVGAGLRFLPATVAIIITAPLAGRWASRIGSRIPMTIGLAMVGAGMLLYLGVNEFTPYLHWFWIQPIQGVGMGLTMAPMTAAVMSSVPPARSGMASATTNASREVGGTFGIALLGAILTARLNSVMTGALTALGIPSAVQSKIEFAMSHGGAAGASKSLPQGVDFAALDAAFKHAFVDGMHVAMLVAAAALLGGSVVAFLFIEPHAGERHEKPQAGAQVPEAVSA
jgi:MFS family permease